MIAKIAKLSLWAISILFIGVILASMCAAAQTADDKTPATQTVTGCLQKGLEPGGFFVIGPNDQHWELYQNSKVSLAEHVGQKVTVTGTFPNRSAAQEEISQPYEKKETAGRKHSDFQVSSLKVVSPTCSK